MSNIVTEYSLEEESEQENASEISLISDSEIIDKKENSLIINRGQIEVLGEDIKFEDHRDINLLKITNNVVTKIQNLEELSELKKLDLSFNVIETLENIESVPLTYLNLSHNRIHTIFVKNELKNLQNVNLSFNMLERFSHSNLFTALRELNLSNCFFTDFSSLSGLQLQKLDISNNRIFDDQQFDCSTLTILNVSYNNLTSIASFAGLNNLTFLDVSFNPIPTEGFDCNFSLTELKKLNIAGTELNNLDIILKTFPNVEEIDLRQLNGLNEENFFDFISGANNLKSVDVRGVFFDNEGISSLADFKQKNPEDFERYMAFRKNVLERVKNFPFQFDGIEAESPDEVFVEEIEEIVEEEEEKSENADIVFNGNVYSPEQQFSLLNDLISKNNELREILGLESRNIDPEQLTNEEIRRLIFEISEENEKFAKQIAENEDLEEKKGLALKIMRDIERMKAKMERRSKREISLPEVNKGNIDAFIAKVVEKYRRVRERYEQFLLISETDILAKIEQKILEKAKNPMLPDEPTALEKNAREYRLIYKWLSMKMQKPFSVRKVVKLNTFREFTEKSDKYKWMQLVVTLSEDSPNTVVSDHCGFFTEGKYKFIIYALDSGKQVVSYREREDFSDLEGSKKHKYDTKLFYYKEKHAIYVRNTERMVPLYVVSINVK